MIFKNSRIYGRNELMKMSMKYFISLLFLLPQISLAAELVDASHPPLNVEETVYLGDQMLLQRKGAFFECATPENNIKVGGSTWYELLAAKPVCRPTTSDEYFYSFQYTLMGNCRGFEDKGTCFSMGFAGKIAPLPTTKTSEPISIVDEGETYAVGILTDGFGGRKIRKRYLKEGIPKDEIEIGQKFFTVDDSFQQTIEYAGKSGAILRFIYAEFKDNLARDSFTREFQIDLSEGNVLAYKGAVIEVVSATNATITYKVIRNFKN